MSDTEKRDRGMIRIDEDECKGCGLCVEACLPKAIRLSDRLNHSGYRPAIYAGKGCTGCGICFMACPEPGAITVYRTANPKAIDQRGFGAGLEGASPCASN
jgi:NAD-dependent dihydropyrimidine dehydrogenase PreA subunit